MNLTETRLVDWHTHLWSVEDHLTHSAARQLKGLGETNLDADASRYRHEVGAATAGSVLVGAFWPKIGIVVPNEEIARYVAESDDDCYGLASVDPSRGGAGNEAESALRGLGLHGFKLAPTYQYFHPWCDEARDVYEVASTYGVPIVYHQGAAFGVESTLENSHPELLDRIAREYPGLRLIVAHFGQPWCEEVVQLMRKHPNVWADVSARYTRPWQLFHALTIAVEYGVHGRLLFGSDFPTQTPRDAEASFIQARDELVPRYFPARVGDVVEELMYERPLSLIFDRPRAGGPTLVRG